jgi:transcriptional regulator with XRE-family HTH domain
VQTATGQGVYGPTVPKPNPRGKAFAGLLRDARAKAGLTQEAVADAARISRNTYGRWEAGEAHRAGAGEVRAVCAVLNLDPRRAAIALGYLDADDIRADTNRLEPDLEEVVDILRDPTIPSVAKEALMDVLRRLRHHSVAAADERHREAS